MTEADQLVLESLDLWSGRSSPQYFARAPSCRRQHLANLGRCVENGDTTVAVDVEPFVLGKCHARTLEQDEVASLPDRLRKEHRHIRVFERVQTAPERLEVFL